MMRSGNPALKSSTFLDLGTGTVVQGGTGAMTLNGTVNKTAFLLVLTLVGAMYTWGMFFSGNTDQLMPWVLGGAIGGFVVALVTVFKKTWAPVTAPLYAVLEGLFIGGVSAIFEQRFPGIVMQAVGLTFGTLAALLVAYRSGLIRATENFKLGVVAATGGIALLYLVNIGMRLFGFEGMGFIHDSSLMGIGFSVVVVIVAALNLVLDFDFIEEGVEAGAPRYMEWYAAFGLLVTLVWLYLELLRLLSKLQSRNEPTRDAMAFAKAIVLPLPPRSGVSESFASSVSTIARRSCVARSPMPRWSSICAAASSSAQGLALPWPAMSGAVPCTASKIAASAPMFAPGARPNPPTSPAHRSDRMSPNRLVVTMTSNFSGCITSFMQHASTIISSVWMSGYCAATSRATFRNRPEVDFMMLALCTIVTLRRPLAFASSYA